MICDLYAFPTPLERSGLVGHGGSTIMAEADGGGGKEKASGTVCVCATAGRPVVCTGHNEAQSDTAPFPLAVEAKGETAILHDTNDGCCSTRCRTATLFGCPMTFTSNPPPP